ncbi:MAG: serine/threonine-protein kinase [Sandaracinus sp.]
MSRAILARRRLPESGERVGDYEVVAPVAQGGMAEVLLVRRRGLGGFERRLAMKVMHPHLAGETSFVNMFLDEARIASCVDHPNVVKVLDVGQHDGLPWLVMEWLDGKSLAGVVTHAPPPSIALRVHVLAEVATGLHAAHEARGTDGAPLGVVHRDVSPQNVHIGYDGVVKLVDFGIAAARGRLTRTETGEVKGKVGYLAPEQLVHPSDGVDRRVDVWAFGVMAWEVLAIRRLFPGSDAGAKLYQIVHGSIPELDEVAAEVPSEVTAIVMQCLERDPKRRPETMSEVARALRRAMSDPHAREALAAHMTECFAEEREALEAQLATLRSRTRDEVQTGERAVTAAPEPAPAARGDERAEPAPRPAVSSESETIAARAPKAPLAPTPRATSPSRRAWLLALVPVLGALGLYLARAEPAAPAPSVGGSVIAVPTPPPEVVPPPSAVPPPSSADAPPPASPIASSETVAVAPAPRTIELEVARGVAVRIAGVEQTERPLRVVLSDEGDAELELRARDGRRARRTVHASDDGATLDLPRRPRRGAPETSSLWGSPY